MSEQQRFAVVGAGKMGQMIARRLVDAEFCKPEQICLTQGRADGVDRLRERFPGFPVVASNSEAIRGASIVFLCVRPQNFKEVASELKGKLASQQLIVSIVTGTSFVQLEQGLSTSSLVRCSTNIGIESGNATSCWMAHESVSEENREFLRELFSLWGDAVEVGEEIELEIAIVGLGSGPAFVLEAMENWIRAMLTAGMPRELAEQIGRSVFFRTSQDVVQNGHPSLYEVQKKVLTPGGITLRMLHLLDKRAFRAAVVEAFLAAFKRVKEFLNKKKEDEEDEEDDDE